VFDVLEVGRQMHSWSLENSLDYIHKQGHGVAVLLNCGESAEQLLAQFEGRARSAQAPNRSKMDLRTYGMGAQILRDLNVGQMRLLARPRKMPSIMPGFGLDVTGYEHQPPTRNK
jgi:3,4-dihydroxy 2-butanone 4-phosphate synthase/GTP cyclohydrolase II